MLLPVQVRPHLVVVANLPLCCIAAGQVERAWTGDDVASGAGVVSSSSSSWRWRASKEDGRAAAARATRTREREGERGSCRQRREREGKMDTTNVARRARETTKKRSTTEATGRVDEEGHIASPRNETPAASAPSTSRTTKVG